MSDAARLRGRFPLSCNGANLQQIGTVLDLALDNLKALQVTAGSRPMRQLVTAQAERLARVASSVVGRPWLSDFVRSDGTPDGLPPGFAVGMLGTPDLSQGLIAVKGKGRAIRLVDGQHDFKITCDRLPRIEGHSQFRKIRVAMDPRPEWLDATAADERPVGEVLLESRRIFDEHGLPFVMREYFAHMEHATAPPGEHVIVEHNRVFVRTGGTLKADSPNLLQRLDTAARRLDEVDFGSGKHKSTDWENRLIGGELVKRVEEMNGLMEGFDFPPLK
jgi:hypothetical protein